ncbi:hypothetical protein L1049_022719 [Liquidambar formosana]|uniref:DUF547 domain-containing protein n=1 Tax=Liquidambar formosana TaxID=63359 RepID=A0AAP0WP35_LIQFO
MDGFSVDEYAEASGKRENGDSYACSNVHAQHRRSRSASDGNSDVSRIGVLHSIQKKLKESHELSPSTRTCGAQSPLHEHSTDFNTNTSSNHQASLEKDQEKSMRIMLERAMGRASSTLSPGHRHFAARAKDLIAEIELLEEEVANREQHVLTLYRSIFEHCVHEKVPTMGKTSMLRTLKDHIYQCPSKLSEEMVRCMASVYCWLRSAGSENPEKNRSPLLSRSSTNVILPRRCTGEDQDWSCKSMVEVSWISTDKSQFSRASFAINNYRLLVEQLERVNVSQMESNAQTAFWVNVYNSLVMHAYLAYGIPHSSLRRLALFHKAAYNIGGHVISANAIEQSIFCFRTPRIGRWLETILSTALRKKSGEERQLISSKFSLPNSQPLVCFALCTGAFSDPVLKVYTASNVKEELEVAKREFLQANVVVKKSRKVFLPKVLERFAKEASIGSDDLLQWVTENLDKKLHESIQKCIDHKTNRKASQVIEWLPYNSRFRYVFSKDLTEKPWWV